MMTPVCRGGDATAIPHDRRRSKEGRQAVQLVCHVGMLINEALYNPRVQMAVRSVGVENRALWT